ncbi:unnamed protein product [marine sediment metagenome]|uniref:Uncharacterized protein n=1 Tax=marine sediment metagenome TaxID=412755 RepID=X1P9F0_9ZZZZ
MANNNNIFRQAKQLLNEKPVLEMNDKEFGIVNTATMPLLLLHEFSDRSIDDGLEELAKKVDEHIRMMVAASRGRVVVTQRLHKPFTQVRILPPLPIDLEK